MADDIDIEEHDVLDNPLIKSIFPDLTILKKEVLDDYEEVSMVERMVTDDDHGLSCKIFEKDVASSTPTNTIITSSNCEKIKYENLEFDISRKSLELDELRDMPHKRNKIILGSKPSSTTQEKRECNTIDKIYTATVKLVNLRPYLDGCEKYCEICFILFPNKEALDMHMKSLHYISTDNTSQCDQLESTKTCGNKIKCNICPKTFASFSGLYKHGRNIHFKSSRRYKTNRKKNNTVNIPLGNSNEKLSLMSDNSSDNSCFHCHVSFPNMQSLIEHIYDTLQTKRKKDNTLSGKYKLGQKVFSKISQKHNLEVQKNKSSNFRDCKKYVYRCPICSYCFNNVKFSAAHLLKKHKYTKKSPLKKVLYDPKCKFCTSEFRNIEGYNSHIQKVHKKLLLRVFTTKPIKKSKLPILFKETKKEKKDEVSVENSILQEVHNEGTSFNLSTDDSFSNGILKSVLFRCNRCDIHFLQSRVAVDHSSHMEILINWKCLLCSRIFKKDDELLHRQQHLVTNNFTVHGICESTISVILYNCTKCTVHYDESMYLQHFPVCGTVPQNHVTCKFCDILIDSKLKGIHDSHHKKKTVKSTDFIFVQTEVIQNNCIQENLLNKEPKEISTDVIGNNSETQFENLEMGTMFNVHYCNTCKCFVNNGRKIMVHKKAQCINVVPATCKLCGLIITQTSISSHRRLHLRKENLTLQNFKFYDLKNNEMIAPPIPEFPHCSVCGVYFANLIAKIRHECGVDDYITCSLCKKMFSELGYKLHMNYHNYRTENCTIELKHSKSLLMSNTKSIIAGGLKPNNASKAVERNSEEGEMYIIYTCKTCNISLDTYDLVVEHCQGHYNSVKIQSFTNICDVCDLIFDGSCYENHKQHHRKSHLRVYKKIRIHGIKFDIFNFTSDYDTWIKSVFDSLSQEQMEIIINKSIYKYENKIKMKVIQEGSHNLTYYKCDKCCCFIDPYSLFKHLGNDCLRHRKHTCRICEISFISVTSKIQHEEIHKQPFKGLKSYRIVLFNRDEDKNFNHALNSLQWFNLYKCRNCDGVVSKFEYNSHLCNKSDLKKCSHCGLLLYSKDFDLHVSKHKEFGSFNTKNIKVMLIGEKKEGEDNERKLDDNLASSSNGKLSNYIFYKCKKCQICFSDTRSTLKHDCSLNIPRSKCTFCELYLEARMLKNHYVLHETDCNLITENITIIDFNNTKSGKSSTNFANECNNTIDSRENAIVSPAVKTANHLEKYVKLSGVMEKKVKLYKCSCGLHFLDNLSIFAHHNVCTAKIRIARQQCSKCGLTFSPNVLFTHLLRHHGNKNVVYIFDIIDVLNAKDSRNVENELR